MPGHAGATGSANAVHVVLGMDRHVEVEHMTETTDVEAPCSHVRTHQQPQLVGLELRQRREPLWLAHVAVKLAYAEPVALERLVQNVHVALAIAEDKRVGDLFGPDHPAQRLPLVQIVHNRQPGHNGRSHTGRAADGDFLGIGEECVCQAADFRSHGGAEEQRLTRLGQEAHDLLDVGNKTHVQHAVRLVDHQNLSVCQQQATTVEQIHQPSWRRDQDVDTLHQRLFLVRQALAANQQGVS